MAGDPAFSFRADVATLAGMKDLIATLVANANLTEAQAAQVASVVKGFLADKLPEPLRGAVDGYLTGSHVEGALDQAKGLLGKLF